MFLFMSRAALVAAALSAPSAMGCPYLSRHRELREDGHDEATAHRMLRSEFLKEYHTQRELGFGFDDFIGHHHYTVRKEKHKCHPLDENCYGSLFGDLHACHFDWEKYIETGIKYNEADGSPSYMFDDMTFRGAGPRAQEILDKVSASQHLDFPTAEALDADDGTTGLAGYTYLGQLLSHDVNKDKLTKLGQLLHPNDIKNAVSAKTDLDTIYGEDEDCDTYLQRGVEKDPIDRFLFPFVPPFAPDSTEPCDFPRYRNGRTIYLPDDRNDNNVVLNRITAVWMKLHNKLVLKYKYDEGLSNLKAFKKAKREVQRNWQSVIVSDLLHNFVKKSVLEAVITRDDCKFYCPGNYAYDEMRTPIEFSTCAYRVFHSRLAGAYRMKTSGGGGAFYGVFEPDPTDATTLEGGHPLTDPVFLKFPFHLFFDENESRVNHGHLLDPLYVDAIHDMPLNVPGNPDEIHKICPADTQDYFFPDGPNGCGEGKCHAVDYIIHEDSPGELFASLALADLARAQVHGVSCGVDMAERAAQLDPEVTVYDLSTLAGTGYGLPYAFSDTEDIPCLIYLALESIIEEEGKVLGHLGSRIIAETVVGMIKNTRGNYLADPSWESIITSDQEVTFLEVVDFVNSACFALESEAED